MPSSSAIRSRALAYRDSAPATRPPITWARSSSRSAASSYGSRSAAAAAASAAAIQSPASSRAPAATSRARPVSRLSSACRSWAHSPGSGCGPSPRISESATRAAATAPIAWPASRRASISPGEHRQLGRVQPVTVQQVALVPVLDPVTAEHRAQPAHQHRQLVLGPGRRDGVPQRVDQHAGRHGLPGAQRDQLQGQPRLPAAQRLRLDPVHAEVAEHPHRQRPHAPIKSRRCNLTATTAVHAGQETSAEERRSR